MSTLLIGYNQLLTAQAILDGNWSLSLFEDLNRLIEAVVLYDRVVLLGDYDPASTDLFGSLTREGVLTPLRDDDVRAILQQPKTRSLYVQYLKAAFGTAPDEISDLALDVAVARRISPTSADFDAYSKLTSLVASLKSDGDVERLRQWLGDLARDSDTHRASVSYLARGLVHTAVAEAESMDYAPDYLRMSVSALAFSDSREPVSKALYDALSNRLQSEVEALAVLGMPAALFIPPLTASVLNSGARGLQIFDEVLHLRRKFTTFRSTYSEFEATLKDPRVPMRDKIAAKTRLFTSVMTLIERDSGQHALNIRTLWDKLISSTVDEHAVVTKLSLSGLVSVLIDQLRTESTKGRARALFDLWTDALNISNYASLLESSFGVTIEKNDYEAVKTYSEGIRIIARRRVLAS